MRQPSRLVLVVATLGLAMQAAYAQTYPNKIVRFVSPFAPGGSTDHNARIVGPALTERWKQQVLVDFRPGAATLIGTDHVAKSAPDGYTFLLSSTQYTYIPALVAKMPYDPLADLVPITLVSISPQAIVSHPSLPVKNVKELITLAKARPGDLNIGTAGSILPTSYFSSRAGAKIISVPFKGAGPMITNLMGGHVEIAMGAISSVQGAVRSGRARLLGVGSLTRSETFPDAPVIADAIPGFEAVAWFGLFAPSGTPKEIIARVHEDVATVLKLPDIRRRLLEIGGDPGGQTPEVFATRVRTEIAKWKEVAATAGIKAQ